MIFHIALSNRELDHTSLGEFPFFAKGSMSSRRTFTPILPTPLVSGSPKSRRDELSRDYEVEDQSCNWTFLSKNLSYAFSNLEWRAGNVPELFESDFRSQLNKREAFFRVNIEYPVGGDNLVHTLSAS